MKMYKEQNYIKLKPNLSSQKMEETVQKLIKYSRNNNQPIWFLSYLYENDRIWFKGFQCLPNHLLQTMLWSEQVVPGNHLIVDMTNCLNVVVYENVLKTIANPNKWIRQFKYLKSNAV